MDSNIPTGGFRDLFPFFLQDSRPYPSQSLPSVTLPVSLLPSLSLHSTITAAQGPLPIASHSPLCLLFFQGEKQEHPS